MTTRSFRIAPTQTNPWGVASLISGIVGFCPLPILGNLCAIVFGVLGIRRANETHTGKGMAVIGLVLGAVGLVLWGTIGLLTHAGYRFVADKAAEGPRQATAAFVYQLAKDDPASLSAGGMSAKEIADAATTLRSNGAVREVAASSFSPADGVLRGTITLEKGKLNYTARLSWNEGNGWVVRSLVFGP